MFKKIVLAAGFVAMTALATGCSDSGGGSDGDTTGGGTETGGTETGGTETGGTETGGTETGGTETGGTGTGGDSGGGTGTGGTGGDNPTGTTEGVWFGNTNFGAATVIIDGSGELTGLSANGSGGYEAVFGNISSPMERFLHRDSEEPGFNSSFTLAGDIPGDAPTLQYNLSVTNDGQQLDNTGGPGNFSLTLATTNDVGAIDVASIAGDYQGQTSFCPADCRLLLNFNIGADGSVVGSTVFNDFGPLALTGTVTPSSSSQYLNVTFTWNDQTRDGVLYRDRTTSRLVLNTVGFNPDPAVDGNQTFSAFLTAQ